MPVDLAERIAVLEAKQVMTDKKLDKVIEQLDELLALFTMAKGIRWFFLCIAGAAVFIGFSGLKAMILWIAARV